MSIIRKLFCSFIVVVALCTISFYMIEPAAAATMDDPTVVLAPAPTTAPLVAPPLVKRTHKHGYIKACEPTRKLDGRKISLEYGKRGTDNPDGRTTIRAGHSKLIAVHRHNIFWISYDTHGRTTSGYVRHIHLP
jgi:hypothetical protein